MILRVKDGCKTCMLLAGVLFEFKFQLKLFRRELLCRHSCYQLHSWNEMEDRMESHGMPGIWIKKTAWNHMESRSHSKRR